MSKTISPEQQTPRATWAVPDWAAELGLGRSTYYTLALRPRSIKIGRRTLIVESPTQYAQRIAELQQVTKAAA